MESAMPNNTRTGKSSNITRVLDDAITSGLEVAFVMTSTDGMPIPSGTRIADARCYELSPARNGLEPRSDAMRLEVHLVAEKARVPEAEEALIRLFEVARHDTGQSRIAADFLLAWWNAHDHGGFDIAHLFSLDGAIACDIVTVVMHLSRCSSAVYADAFGHEDKMLELIARWRPGALVDMPDNEAR